MSTELTLPQKGWLKLAEIKANCFKDLEAAELEIQSILNGYETWQLQKTQESLALAKTKAADSKSQRLHFTGMITEKLINPAMEFEKRNAALIDLVAAKELMLRKEAAAEAEKTNGLNREKEQLKAHIKNEYSRVGTEYRNTLSKIIGESYVKALQDKVPVAMLHEYKAGVISNLSNVQLGKPNRFNRVLVNEEQAKEILLSIGKYNSQEDLDAAIEKVTNETFVMYEEDLKNSDVAAEAIQQQIEEQIATNTDEWVLESSTNNLMAQATPLEMTGGPVVKKSYKIILEDSEEFAMNVIATFIKNWPTAKTKLGTKSWTKLVDPFVKALDKMDTQFPNFKYDEICK